MKSEVKEKEYTPTTGSHQATPTAHAAEEADHDRQSAEPLQAGRCNSI